MRSNFCATRALASGLPVATKRWENCCKNGRRVRADLTELVSSQAKVMLAGIDTLWHCSSFTSVGTQEAFDLANVRATPSGRMGRCLGRA
jgi:hypothetical protein